MLSVVRPRVALPVPELTIFETPRVFSKHKKLQGDHLITTQYEALSFTAKQRLAAAIDRNRVSILTGVLLLVELADMGHDPEYAATVLVNALNWSSKQS